MGEDNNKEPKPQWKGCIIFGIINIVFVFFVHEIEYCNVECCFNSVDCSRCGHDNSID